ncbi:MAG: glycosyltransferase family 9 protein [Fusobacteriaceae bacterium]
MEIKKIIISRTDKIGDLVLSIPSFFMLRKMYPMAIIIVLVKNYNYEIVKNLQYIDRIIKIDDYTQKELLEKIKYYKADVFIALYSDSFINRLALKSKAKIRIGPYSKLSSFLSYNKGVFQKRSKSKKNEAEYNLDLVRKIDKNLFDNNYELNTEIILSENNIKVSEKFFEREGIQEAREKNQSKVLVINPFMGGSAKNITDIQYISLIKKVLIKKNNLEIILVVHINDEERILALWDKIRDKRVHLFINAGELLNIAALIKKSDVYFGGSTGPTHIAGALNKKIVAIYPNKKTQSTIRWGVFGIDKDITYLIPDKENSKENYKSKNFDSYNENTEDILVNLILNKLK